MSKIDPKTNLPVLPEGYWWEISRETENYFDYLTVRIQYRASKRSWWTDKPHPTKTKIYTLECSYEHWSVISAKSNPERYIAEIAGGLYVDAERKWLARDNQDRMNNLLGSYPPKRLDLSK